MESNIYGALDFVIMPQYLHADPKRKITENTLEYFMQSSAPSWVKALFIFLYYFGVRITEALSTHSTDVEVIDDMVHVTVVTLKNKSQDTRRLWIPVTAPYVDYFLSYTRDRAGLKLWEYSRQWSRVKLQEVYPWITPHGFRHNRLDDFAQNDFTPFALKSWAGWSDVRPSETYTQAYDTRKMADKMWRKKSG